MGARESVFSFPGDPPLPDILFELSTIVLVVLIVASALTAVVRSSTWRVWLRRALLALAILPLVGLLAGGCVIANRHFGEWRQLRRQLRLSHDFARAAADEGRSVLAADLPPQLAEFRFSGLQKPVRIRIMSGREPYVGVDFGEGANAMFDPVTMLCTYSD
ncbi:hypothetical protein K2Z84_01220 [Candidatus Binatia bacterium]|nr:hypothetical protein [Candidatus Binatia bacterium]